MADQVLPVIIQGGMGVGVSHWPLARAVATAGQLGVVSGVALDTVLARRLQRGDPGGHLRDALDRFPGRQAASWILSRYLAPDGGREERTFRPVPRLGLQGHRASIELTVAGNFTEVLLAKQGHCGTVGVNYLEKIQMATPAALYGAMLAGVDYVLVGAGIPSHIPHLMDELAEHRPVELPVTVAGGEQAAVRFDPSQLFPTDGVLRRPKLLAIVSSAILATRLARDPRTRPDGFVLESPGAGGHSAPPRGRLQLSQSGEPVYGPRDEIEVEKVAALGLPFWLAGGYSSPQALAAARAIGAAGVQVGSAFALCEESGIEPGIRRRLLDRALRGDLRVRNDPRASPTAFPFKVAELPDTLADESRYAARPRHCDLGYLRTPYRTAEGKFGYRCPAEPVTAYIAKGGEAEDTERRRCLCNGLMATIGLGQQRPDGYLEPPLVTLGQDLGFLTHLLAPGVDSYHAAQVIDYLLG